MKTNATIDEILIFPFVALKIWLISIVQFFSQFLKPNYKNISQQNVVITGAANGLGRKLCLFLSNENCNIIAIDINESNLLETSKIIKEKTGKSIIMFICDIRSKKFIDKLYEKITQKYGFIDILINNAGVTSNDSILDISEDKYAEVFDINLHACTYLTKKCLPQMLSNNHGHLVYVSSMCSYVSAANLSTYCATKAALTSFVESLYLEVKHIYKKNGVNVTIANPFIISTGLFNNCKSRLPFIFPPLNEDDVAKRIIHGIKRNQYNIIIGRIMNIILILKAILPMSVIYELYKVSGGISIMDDYKDIRTKARYSCYSQVNAHVFELDSDGNKELCT